MVWSFADPDEIAHWSEMRKAALHGGVETMWNGNVVSRKKIEDDEVKSTKY